MHAVSYLGNLKKIDHFVHRIRLGIILKWIFKKECGRHGTNLCDWGWGFVVGFCGNVDGLLCSKKRESF